MPQTGRRQKLRKVVAGAAALTVLALFATYGEVLAALGVELDIDRDTETALNDVRNAVDSVRGELPQDMTDPVVSKITTSGRSARARAMLTRWRCPPDTSCG